MKPAAVANSARFHDIFFGMTIPCKRFFLDPGCYRSFDTTALGDISAKDSSEPIPCYSLSN